MNSDLNIYDRQSRTYGIEATVKIQNAKIIIFGQKSDLLYEVAKNLILSGLNNLYIVKDHNLDKDISITNIIYDPSQPLYEDFEIRLDDSDEPFFGSIHNITYDRIIKELKTLNQNVKIELLNTNEDYKKNIYLNAVMIFINHDPIRVMELNNSLRNSNKFIVLNAFNNGVEIINDFNEHQVIDVDGENYERITIIDINDGTIKTANKHNLSKNDRIKLYYNDLICELNVSKVINSNIFVVNDFISIPIIKFMNGYIERIKISMTLHHKPIMNYIIADKFNTQIDISKINPLIQYYMGSLIASESIKSITHKYMPFTQVELFSWSDEIYARPNFETIKKLNDLKILIVGSGAIGCELLKNLASINIRSIEITDPDHIELSNLSRQFLFGINDIKKSKSEIASKKIMYYNPLINVKSYNKKLDVLEQEFIDEKFSNVDIIFNALDNLQGRLFVDANCIKHHKPLFESGTMGNSGNTQAIIPNITESYGASKDPQGETNYAVCTIKHFPSLIQHTIHYAMEDFTNLFVISPKNFIDYLIDANQNNNIQNRRLFNILCFINSINSIDGYIIWAYNLFYDRFVRRINAILQAHPLDSLNDNKPFWSNGKRAPIGTISEELFNSYMVCTVKLLINTYNLNNIKFDKDKVINFKYDNIDYNLYIDDPDNNDDVSIDSNKSFKNIIQINCQEFEKDNDENSHIEYITACSNSRASIYNIPNISFFETKGIAGKIIPALAVTTSIVSSLITIEMLKYVINKNRPITDYKSYFLNLATNFIVDGEPNPPKKIIINNIEFNEWTKFNYNSNFILKDLIKELSDLFKTEITMVMLGQKMLFTETNNIHINKSMRQILEENQFFLAEKRAQHKLNNCTISIGSADDMLELPDINIMMD